MQPGICRTVTGVSERDTVPAFSFSILPEIERDLKICDLVKDQNVLLTGKVAILSANAATHESARQKAERETKKEKRKRITSHVIRTIIEVAVIVVILM
jgi:hypothetical protein